MIKFYYFHHISFLICYIFSDKIISSFSPVGILFDISEYAFLNSSSPTYENIISIAQIFSLNTFFNNILKNWNLCSLRGPEFRNLLKFSKLRKIIYESTCLHEMNTI
jgi:hypothetical protein